MKKCKVCRQEFSPRQPMAVCCSPQCAITHAVSKRGKAEKVAAVKERKATREKLDALKTNAKRAKEAEAVVNKYVRLRDKHLGCVSCDKPASWDGQWHASHFRSVGAASGLRFHLWNIHKACSVCNNWKSGNLSEYEPRLRQKIGDDKVDWLRTQNAVNKTSAEYLNRVKAIFSKKVKRMESRSK